MAQFNNSLLCWVVGGYSYPILPAALCLLVDHVTPERIAAGSPDVAPKLSLELFTESVDKSVLIRHGCIGVSFPNIALLSTFGIAIHAAPRPRAERSGGTVASSFRASLLFCQLGFALISWRGASPLARTNRAVIADELSTGTVRDAAFLTRARLVLRIGGY